MTTDYLAEVWRHVNWIPEVVGRYEVSSLGRVRVAPTATGARLKPGRIRRTWTSSTTGYLQVTLHAPGRVVIWKTVHDLVCTAFHGPRPGPEYEVGHLDADRSNSEAANLTWQTPSENRLQSYQDGRAVTGNAGRLGEANAAAKLTAEDVRAIRAEFIAGRNGNAQALARRFNVTTTAIRAVATGKTWRHVGDAEEGAP